MSILGASRAGIRVRLYRQRDDGDEYARVHGQESRRLV